MPSTRYRYYTVVMANALLVEGESIPDSSGGRPDQYLQNLLSAYGYEKSPTVSFSTLLDELERDGLTAFRDDLIERKYWESFVKGVAPREAIPYYTWEDPLLPLLDAAAVAFKDAVDLVFDAGDVVAGGDIRDLRYLLDGVALDEIVGRVAQLDPSVANALLRATRRGGVPFDEHPLGAQFLLARLFRLTEEHLGCWLLERSDKERAGMARATRDGERLLERHERFLEDHAGERKRKVSVGRLQSELDALNPTFARHVERLRRRAPHHLTLDKLGTYFRPQHIRPHLTGEGNPLKGIMQRLKKTADPAMQAAVHRLGDLHRDPAISLVLALALPGSASILQMLEQELGLRRLAELDGVRFPSGRTLYAWLYGSDTEDGVPPSKVPVGLANFAERDRLELACPSVLAEQAREDLAWWLTSEGLNPVEANVIEAHTEAFMDVLPVVAPGGDPAQGRKPMRAACQAAQEFWGMATYPHLARAVRASRRRGSLPGVESLPEARGKAIPWTEVFGRPDDADAGLEDGPRYARLDFTEVWPIDEAPLAPSLHPFSQAFAISTDEEREVWATDHRLEDQSARLEQWRSEVFPKTTDVLLRALEAWAERVRLQAEPHVADARTRLFFLDGGKAGERTGFGPGSVALPETDPETWASDGPPPFALIERFVLIDDADRADCEEVLDALQAFVEVAREVETALQREWPIVMKEMRG